MANTQFLAIHPSEEKINFQLDSNFNNWWTSLILGHYKKLLPFKFEVTKDNAIYCKNFFIHVVNTAKLYESEIQYLQTTELDSNLIKKAQKYSNNDTYYFLANTYLDKLPEGYIYQIEIILTNNNNYKSDIFSICGTENQNAIWYCEYSMPDITIGQNPLLTVTVHRLDNGASEIQQIKVTWNILQNAFKYAITTIFGEGNEINYTETQEIVVAGGKTKQTQFSLPANLIKQGINHVTVESLCGKEYISYNVLPLKTSELEITFTEIIEMSQVKFNLYFPQENMSYDYIYTSAMSNAFGLYEFDTANMFYEKVKALIEENGLPYTITIDNNKVTIKATNGGSQYDFNSEINNFYKTISLEYQTYSGYAGTTSQQYTILENDTILLVDFGPGGGVDKLEIFVNGIKKASTCCKTFQNDGLRSSNYGYPTDLQFDSTLYNAMNSYSVYYNNDFFVGDNHIVGASKHCYCIPTRIPEFEKDTGLKDIGIGKDMVGNILYNTTTYYSGQRSWIKDLKAGDNIEIRVEGGHYDTGWAYSLQQLKSLSALITAKETKY